MHETILMLQAAGFNDVKVYGNHEDEPATGDTWARIYRAGK